MTRITFDPSVNAIDAVNFTISMRGTVRHVEKDHDTIRVYAKPDDADFFARLEAHEAVVFFGPAEERT